MRSLLDSYLAGFLARCDALRQPGQVRVDGAGAHGLVPSTDDRPTSLVVDDDAALEQVADVAARASNGTVNVFDTAPRCIDLLARDPRWLRRAATAMVAPDLSMLRAVHLPGDLVVRPVARLATDRDGVELADAVALAIAAEPLEAGPGSAALAAHLRSLPASLRLFAALDADGQVRATSGVGVFGRHAHVLLVNTDPDRRREGIGGAMTVHALLDAVARGAAGAYLDASPHGTRVYARIGFEQVSPIARFNPRT